MAPGLEVNGLKVVSARDMKCGCCGICCRTYSKVDISVSDVFHISEYLGTGTADFVSKYCKTMSNNDDRTVFLFDIEGGCKFQKDDKCTIYPVRTDMCALYPFVHTSLYTSRQLKKDLEKFPSCFVHSLPDDLVIVPDLERMADSRIMFMVMEPYLVMHGGAFREEDALEFHRKGMAQRQNPRLRNVVHLQLLNEFLKDPPRHPDTKKPLLSPGDIKNIYSYARGLPRD